MMSEVECAWMAGLIDGEGTIVRTKNGRDNYSLRLSNTSRPLLDRIMEVAGTGALYDIPKHQSHHKSAWLWQVNTRNAALLLRQVLPWLIVKRERAEEVLSTFDHTQ